VRAFLKDKSGLAQRTLLRQEDMGARKVASVRGAHFEAIRADVSPANDGKSSQSWNGKSDEDFSDLSFECTIEEWPSSSLSMPSGDADDGPDFVSKLEELGMRLASADRPVMVRGLAKDGFKWDLDSLLAAHGSQTNLQARPPFSFFFSVVPLAFRWTLYMAGLDVNAAALSDLLCYHCRWWRTKTW